MANEALCYLTLGNKSGIEHVREWPVDLALGRSLDEDDNYCPKGIVVNGPDIISVRAFFFCR